jgi:hypothetical protein
MAFQAPQRQQAHRQQLSGIAQSAPIDTATQQQSSIQPRSREWVLFSPHPSSATGTATISTTHTPHTLERSLVSELGSLRSRDVQAHNEEDYGLEDDETEDLDSLDDGLHAFGPLHAPNATDTLLPAHDGLGTFPVTSTSIQDRIWQHERNNPARRRRQSSARRSTGRHVQRSRELEVLEEEQNRESEQEQWRMRRIEEWRMEQSTAILEEIELESRRRRKQASIARTPSKAASATQVPAVDVHASSNGSAGERESFLERFTKKVIRDIIGIDDQTLCYIFGEDVAKPDNTPTSSTPRQSDFMAPPLSSALSRTGNSWEERLLARVAEELDILVNQLTDHPEAFSTYREVKEDHIPYAGLTASTSSTAQVLPLACLIDSPVSSMSTPQFQSTLQQHLEAETSSYWGVEDSTPPTQTQSVPNEQAHWERSLDIRMVFDFLRDHLLRRKPTAATPSMTMNPATQPSTTPTSHTRAALIRQAHPLISSLSRTQHRAPLRSVPQAPAPPTLASVLGRRVLSEDSCASQSSKRTKTGSVSISIAGGPNRGGNYWDWGGSEGAGGWGEV